MRLSPLDIKKQEFNRGFRGFEEQEVTAYLEALAEQWSELLDETRSLETKVTDLENKLVHYQRVEDALQEALNTAKSSSKTKIANAEQEAALILREAASQAESIINKARSSNQTLEHNNMLLEQRRTQIMSRLRAFLSSEIDLLSGFEQERLPQAPPPVKLPTEHMRFDAPAPAQPAPPAVPLPTASVDDVYAESKSTATIHNVEIDVNKYAEEVSAEPGDWAQQEQSNDYFQASTDAGTNDPTSHDTYASDESNHSTDRPPNREGVSPHDMDKIRKILDNLD